MTTIEAERIGGRVYRYLKERPRTGRVASLFRHGFNVLFDEESDPGFVSIQSQDAPLHPWALGVPEVSVKIQLGSAVSAESPRISLGPTTIHWQRATCYALQITPHINESMSRARGRTSLLPSHLEEHRDPFEERIDGILREWREHGDPGALLDLIGLGSGSTPSGDDVLVGVVAGLTALGKSDAYRSIHAEEIGKRTSLPSAQMIAAALDGSFPEPLCNLVAALGREDVDDVEIRGLAERLVALGENSGRAMLRGLIAAVAGPEGP
jgi:hypothetical protein